MPDETANEKGGEKVLVLQRLFNIIKASRLKNYNNLKGGNNP
jgi:hypothetical protein